MNKSNIFSKYSHLFLFFAISLWIVHFSFSNPYLFLLDLAPTIKNPGLTNTIYGKVAPAYGGWIANTLSIIFPPEIYHKFLLFLIIFLSCYSMYSLTSIFSLSKSARIYAAILYAINPYTYARIVVGHLAILFAYSLLPLALKVFVELLDHRKLRNSVKFALILSIIATNSHTLFISLLIFATIFIFKLYKTRSVSLIKPVVISLILFLVLNTYWLVPLITAQKETILTKISSEDLAVFAPKIESFSALFTIASMHGFWRPAYIYAKDFLPFWQPLFVFILFLAVHGFITYYKHEKIGIYVKALAVVWILGLILATGIKSPFADFFRFIFDHTPLMKGMRDTHKFVTMLALSYACLGALGLAEISKSLENKKPIVKKAIIVGILLIPIIYSFTFFNGFAEQIKPTDFPKDWYEVNEFLNKDKDDFKVLFFPWHNYMDFHWVPNKDKRTANPAPNFFDKEVISAKNIEVPGIYRQIYTTTQLYIDYLLSKRNEITNFGELVSIIGVKYILLTKEADYENYFFLFNQTDLELVLETENFYVFENKHYKGKVFSVDGIGYVKDWDELINISKKEDITKRLYVIGDGEKEGGSAYKKLEYEKISPVRYVIKDKPLRYIIFTEEYSKDWKLNGKEPMKAYGVVNSYIADGNEIVYERFYKICLPAYILSIITFLGCVWYLFHNWRR